LSHLAISEANAKATAWILPDDGNIGPWTDNSTGTALQAPGIIKTDLSVLDGIKACRAGISAWLGLTGCTHGLVQHDVSLIVVHDKFVNAQ